MFNELMFGLSRIGKLVLFGSIVNKGDKPINDIDVALIVQDGRLAGAEFAAILPATEADRAIEMAEELRRKIADAGASSDTDTIRFTVSIGLATSSSEIVTLENLLKSADTALYKAKSTGRNRVVAV